MHVPRTVNARLLFFRPLHLVLLVLLVIVIFRHFLDETKPATVSNSGIDQSSRPHEGIDPSKELVVASRDGDDTSWIGEHLPDWHTSLYVMDNPRAKLTVPANKGRESMAYLT